MPPTKPRKTATTPARVNRKAAPVAAQPKHNNVWASNAPAGGTQSLTMPSGQTCDARKLSIEDFLAAGILLEMDALTPLVEAGPVTDGRARMQGHKKPAKQQASDEEQAMIRQIAEKPELMTTIVKLVDKLMPFMVVDPVVSNHVDEHGVLIPDEDRVPGVVYTDQVDIMDKMYLFEWGAGGLENLAQFRNATSTTMGGVGA